MPRIFIIIFNGLLSLVIAAIALSVIVVPFLPELIYAETGDVEIENIVQETRKTHKEEIRENFLLIPKIRVASIINEGDSYLALDQGAWRRPLASNPKEGGNTVIVAHRFLNGMQERSFYHLPKLVVGDEIYIYWDNEEYVYEVFETRTVEPYDKEIEDNSDEPILTLYTCTPIWTSDKRFVVLAKPKLIEETI